MDPVAIFHFFRSTNKFNPAANNSWLESLLQRIKVLAAQRPQVLIRLKNLFSDISKIGMPTSFSYSLQQAPEVLQNILREDGIGGHYGDAKIFLRLYETPRIVADWKRRSLKPMPQKDIEAVTENDTFHRSLEMLRYGALATPCYENLTGLQKWRVDNGFTPVAEHSVAPDGSKCTPRSKLGGGLPTAQRITEVNLKEKFAFIITGTLAPFAAMIPFMAKHMEKTDRWDHWKKLVGKARYSTLRNVARMLRNLISLCPNILPPAENLVRDILGKMNETKKSPTVIMSYWQVLVRISKNRNLRP